jgi:hypothetical protein
MSFLKSIWLKFAKRGAHKGVDIAIDNTVGAWAKETAITSDDHLVEHVLKPEAHQLIENAFSRFKGISIKTYFLNLWKRSVGTIDSIPTITSMIADLEARKAHLQNLQRLLKD